MLSPLQGSADFFERAAPNQNSSLAARALVTPVREAEEQAVS